MYCPWSASPSLTAQRRFCMGVVEQFFDNRLRHGGNNCFLLIGECCFIETGLQFSVSDLPKLLMERLNSRVDLKDLQLVVEPLRLFGDDLLCSGRFLLATLEVGGDNGFEIINVIKEGVVNLTHIGFYVAWCTAMSMRNIYRCLRFRMMFARGCRLMR